MKKEEKVNKEVKPKKEERMNYDQIMALLDKLALNVERRDEEAEKRMKESEKRLKKIEELYGGVSNNIGHQAEEFFQNAFGKTLTFAGIKFDTMIRNMSVQKKENCDFDIVLVNGDTIAIIETKNRIHPKFVEELVTKKLPQFRSFFPIYANYKIYLGVAGLSFDKSVVGEANKFGVGIIRQDGKSIEVNADAVKVY